MRYQSSLRYPVITSIMAGAMMWAPSAGAAQDNAPKDEGGSFVAGRILVKGKPGLSDSKFLNILAKHGGKRASKINGIDVSLVNVPPGLEKKIIAELQANTTIDFAEVDHIVKPAYIANDTYFGSQWHLSKIGAPTSWDIASASGITVAILDSGVKPNHTDLASVLVPGWNFYDNNSDTTDVNGHGTAVAGSTGAIINNSIGVAGVADKVKIMPLRVSSSTGASSQSTFATAIVYAADHGARVANCSWEPLYANSSVTSAANYMKSKGGLVVVAAGNNSVQIQAPVNDSMVVASATDSADAMTSWSSFGPVVSVAAPGINIISTSNSGGYGNYWGTSFSSPITAGVIASMMAANPTLGATQIQSLLYSTAKDLGAVGKDIYYGNGRIDAAAAVAAAKTATAVDALAPTVAITAPTVGTTLKGVAAVDVTATDNVGVAKVELLVNGALYATDISAPFSFAWDTTPLGNASPTLTAIAYDAAGNKTTSAGVKVGVGNIQDITSPRVTITSPINGSKVSSNLTVKATATDDMAVTSMAVLIDGAQVAATASSSISYSWNVKKATAGTHTITVTAADSSSNVGQASVTVSK